MPFVLSMPVLSLKKDRSTNGGGDARELLIVRLQFSAFDRLRPNGLGEPNRLELLNGLGLPSGLGVPNVLGGPDRLRLRDGLGGPNGLGLPDVLGVPKECQRSAG